MQLTTDIDTIQDATRAYLASGLCVLPARRDQKRPTVGSWKKYQERMPTEAEVSAWMANNPNAICILCGRASGNLEIIDFDGGGELFPAWWERILEDLRAKLVVESTPSGGRHVIYRCEEVVCGNLKLAQRADSKQIVTLIETRGEGGLFLCAPTEGYELVEGDLCSPPVLTQEERDTLLQAAWELNEHWPEAEDPQPTSTHRERPGGDYNARGDVREILHRHGWTLARPGANEYWRRPGKNSGWSATLKDRVFYVFSSNAAPFEPNRAYSPFSVYALLEHDGDYERAARSLRERGFGNASADNGHVGVDLSALTNLSTVKDPTNTERSALAEPHEGTSPSDSYGVDPTILTEPQSARAPDPFSIRVDAVCLADVDPEPVVWLWPGRFALGKLSLIAGEPGLGKSFLTLDMAARVSRGDGWPCDGGTESEPGGVVLLSAEDDIKDTIVPRLITAGADRSRIQAMRALYQPQPGLGVGVEKPVPFSLLEHVPQLEQLIQRAAPCKLVVVDPVSAFLGGTDSHNNSEVRSALSPLSDMAARSRVAVVAVTHLNKGQGSALNRVIGSVAFTAAARAAYVITRDEDDPARRLMLPAKNNLGRDADGFAYRLVGDPIPCVQWEPAPVSMSADEAVSGHPRGRGPKPDALRDAEGWLFDFLSAGPQPAKEVYVRAAEDGHTRDTIRRAKAALGIETAKDGFQGPWTWVLPGSGPLMTGMREGDND
ncbi:MAG: AAA family ATPase [Phycisphaerae bacterium]|nr:AAA family ATPase [Phycisphaerae bacterium]